MLCCFHTNAIPTRFFGNCTMKAEWASTSSVQIAAAATALRASSELISPNTLPSNASSITVLDESERILREIGRFAEPREGVGEPARIVGAEQNVFFAEERAHGGHGLRGFATDAVST